ncbi:hypothetical protein X975_19815, partial [Stegodyphus mimosarum]
MSRLNFYVLSFLLLIYLWGCNGESNASKVADFICGTGGKPRSTPACIPRPGPPRPSSFVSSPVSSGYSAFVSCWEKLASCYTCGTDRKSDDMSECPLVTECTMTPENYDSPDIAMCYWKIFCNTPAGCQIELEGVMQKEEADAFFSYEKESGVLF